MNEESKTTNERGSSLVGFVGLVVPVQETFFCLFFMAALVGPVQNIFSSSFIVSILLSPSPSQLGTGQAAVLGRLSLSMFL